MKVAIIGAGTMGSGIAQVCIVSGYETCLFDTNQDALDKGQEQIKRGVSKAAELGKVKPENIPSIMAKLHVTTHLNDLVADVVIEAIVENLAIKTKLFQDLEAINTPSTLLCSNTSSLSITSIGSTLAYPGRFAGLHFFNPAPAMKLVEIAKGQATDEATIKSLKELVAKLGKVAVLCVDSPGFIVNRVARPYYTEAIYALETGGGDHAQIDSQLENSGFKLGAFKLMDLIGNDVNFAVTTSLFTSYFNASRFRPSITQLKKVEANHLGKKTKRGFYAYE